MGIMIFNQYKGTPTFTLLIDSWFYYELWNVINNKQEVNKLLYLKRKFFHFLTSQDFKSQII